MLTRWGDTLKRDPGKALRTRVVLHRAHALACGPSGGFTLPELVIALALLGIVAAGVLRALLTHQRVYRAQAQRIDVQQTLRAAEALLVAELRELDAADGDLAAATPTSLTIRAARQLGFLCAPPLGAGPWSLTIREDLFFGTRDFNRESDSIFVYHEGAPGWVRGALATDPTPATCADGSPGRRLLVSLAFGSAQAAEGIAAGAPLRGFEPVTYSLYRASDARWYLGILTRTGGPRQPVVGPLRGSDGITFEYLSSAGVATLVAGEVAEIRITLRAETDSLVTAVSLRNNRRS